VLENILQLGEERDLYYQNQALPRREHRMLLTSCSSLSLLEAGTANQGSQRQMKGENLSS